ncbi:MAG: hypothetical protein ACRD6U_11150 [Nitrososphaeraceae archaeon]
MTIFSFQIKEEEEEDEDDFNYFLSKIIVNKRSKVDNFYQNDLFRIFKSEKIRRKKSDLQH